MAKKDSFLLRTDPALLDALRRWADDELRSVNGQIEFLLRRALMDAGRLKGKGAHSKDDGGYSSSRRPNRSGDGC